MGGVAMNCMKCGRKYDSDQAFCPHCLDQMAKNPVRPDVIINLPNRQDVSPKKAAPRKRVRTPEEQILHLKKSNRHLIVALCLMTLLAGILVSISIDFFRQLDVQRFLGQNYSTMETIN